MFDITIPWSLTRWLGVGLAVLGLGGCGYNDFQKLDEETKAGWAEVLNQYSAGPTSSPTSSTPSRAKPASSRRR
jgi:hypothetical protein